MTLLASSLVATSSAIVLVLGLIHLYYTFNGVLLHPRDPKLTAALKAGAPLISRQTTMWKAWLGFNASHSFGAILFGAVYGYLALAHPAVLFESYFLLGLALLLFVSYAVVAKLYWFRIPFRGIVVAMLLYVAGVIAASA